MASEKTTPNIRTRSGAVIQSSTITKNNAVAVLRAHIRHLPPDINLSIIRTMTLATRYNKFQMESLEESDQKTGPSNFNSDLTGEGNTESISSLITGR